MSSLQMLSKLPFELSFLKRRKLSHFPFHCPCVCSLQLQHRNLASVAISRWSDFLFRQKIIFRYCHVEYGIMQRLSNKKFCRGRKGLCLREANASVPFLSLDLRPVWVLHLTPHSVMEWRFLSEYGWLACICRQSSCAQMVANEHDVDIFVKELPCLVFMCLLSRLHSVNDSVSRAARRCSHFLQIVTIVDFRSPRLPLVWRRRDMRPTCTTPYLSALRKTKSTPGPFEIGLGKGDRPHYETPNFLYVSAPRVRVAMKTKCSLFRPNSRMGEIPHTLYLQCCRRRCLIPDFAHVRLAL